MAATLNIVFEKPGFFLMDTRLEVLVDGNTVYDGGFMDGFARELEVNEGPHRIEAMIHLGGLGARKKQWDVDVIGARVTATLRYSRLWGNFKGKLRITPG